MYIWDFLLNYCNLAFTIINISFLVRFDDKNEETKIGNWKLDMSE